MKTPRSLLRRLVFAFAAPLLACSLAALPAQSQTANASPGYHTAGGAAFNGHPKRHGATVERTTGNGMYAAGNGNAAYGTYGGGGGNGGWWGLVGLVGLLGLFGAGRGRSTTVR